MIYNPGRIPLLLSISIAVTSTVLLWLFSWLFGVNAILLSLFVGFAVAFFVTRLIFNRVVFRDLKNLQEQIADLGLAKSEDPDAEAGSLTSLEKISADVTRLLAEKQNEIDRLKKLEAFRKDFIADVSHELKTPIFAAQGFVHTLLDGAVKEKAVRKKFLKKAAKSLDGLDMLVQDLLTLSHIETGQIKMRLEEIDLYKLTEEVFEQFKGKSNKRDIALRVEGSVRKVLVCGDGQRIGQVMTNFISNAIKHSHEGGEVVVSFVVRKRSVVTRISDTGEGIPPEHINRIFERFYRVDKSRSREKGGTGLGLAIVKHILDGHNSKAEVESQPGKGSTFSFTLPRPNKQNNGIREPDERAKDKTREAERGL